MQLAILIAMLMLVGQSNFTQIKPIIEQLGGEEAKSAIKQAEELKQIISAVQTFASPQTGGEQPSESERPSSENQPLKTEQTAINSHPLDPVKGIADDKILSALSRYVALGE